METVRMGPDTNFVIGINLKRSSMVPKPVSVALSRSQNARRMNAGRLDHVCDSKSRPILGAMKFFLNDLQNFIAISILLM